MTEPTTTAALARFRAFLYARALHSTAAREAVVKAVLARDGHFNVEELAGDLRSKGVSTTTVYRALPLLLEAGLVQPALMSGERRRYERALGREHHDHLVCGRCGAVIEFRFEAFESLQDEVAAKHGYQLTAHFHELIGVCPDCQTGGEPPR